MLKKIILLSLSIVCYSQIALSQNLTYQWEAERELYTLDKSLEDEALIYLKYHKQYVYNYEGEDLDLVLYQTEHEIMKVNNDNALARSNRIYISMQNASELVDLQARTITPSGKVITFDKSEIKEIDDEETGSGFKIFAIEGAVVGSEIEYYYTKKMSPDYFGREYFQFSEPVVNASFVLVCPDNLEFAFKSYNGLDEVNSSKAEGANIYTLVTDDVPPLKKEEFSSYDGSKRRLEFKLNFNAATNSKLFQWSDATELLHSRAFIISKEDEKAIEELVDAIELKKFKTLPLKLAAIEDNFKTNFYLDENASFQGADISFILENRIGSKIGLTKLMLNAFQLVGANPELVLTADRSKVPFDGDFQSYNYLQEYIIYLPGEDTFVAPYNPEYRFGMVPAPLTATEGLFIKEIVNEGVVTPDYRIGKIPPLSAGENLDKMEVSVKFNEDLTANTVKLVRTFNGYQAAFIKAVYPLIEEARKQELLKSLVKFLAADAAINTLQMDDDFNFESWEDPLVVNSEFESPSFIELAGDIVLLKAGELIGPQTELYQENERMMAVENDFNREYQRSISIELPEGYQIENLDDLNFDEKVEVDGNPIYYFKSGYKLDGNTLKIQVDEGYEEIYHPKEDFEAFRKVINAAADWNKIVLVMSK